MKGEFARHFSVDHILPDQGPDPMVPDAQEAGDGHVQVVSGPLDHQPDGGGQPVPALELALELLPALARQGIELRAPAKVGFFPVGGDPSLVLEAMESRVERTLLNREHLAGQFLNAFRDRPAVQRIARDGLEDEEVEGSLQEI